MRIWKAEKTVGCLLAGMLYLAAPSPSHAVEPVKLSGFLSGTVKDPHGVPLMGATVIVYNHQDRPISRMLTNERGHFQFAGLFPAMYSLRVSLASFIPAVRKDILVQPGMRSMLSVSLSTLFSSIQFDYPAFENATIMSDDWKWVLRSASETRPVMRLLPEQKADASTLDRHVAAFSDTRGILRLSAGDGPMAGNIGSEADMGTAFALATSLYNNGMLQVSGNLGYGSQTGVPAAAFRTSYSRGLAGGQPVISVTMRQLALPGRYMSAALAGGESEQVPGNVLRSVSAGFDDRTQISDKLSVQYGFTLDSVSFMNHLNYLSPYARLSYAINRSTNLELAYSAGNARPDLAESDLDDADLQRDLNTLAMFPRVSMEHGRSRVQRGEEYEIALTRKEGSRSLRLSAYRELLFNTAVTMVAPDGTFSGNDVLPDMFSNSSVFDAGTFDTVGYSVAFTQDLGSHVSATAVYGNEGGLTTSREELVSNSPDELRSMIHAGRRQSLTARVAATVPWTGTHLIASYQWLPGDRQWVMAGNLYSTQSFRSLPGFNVYIRQPIPGFGKRLEATADLRNVLAQGYLGLRSPNGGRVLLVDNPRSVRGGLAFIF
jgi:hypothetical protein